MGTRKEKSVALSYAPHTDCHINLENKKSGVSSADLFRSFNDTPHGRSDGIRTHGLLVPNQARYHLRYTPIIKPQQVCLLRLWLGMRGSNSHGRSQSPLHYHYANPHWSLGLCSWALPSTFIDYSALDGICQHFF